MNLDARGRIVQLTDRGGKFKIGIVLGPARGVERISVRVWRHNGRAWTKPQATPIAVCRILDESYYAMLDARQRSVVRAAMLAVADLTEIGPAGAWL